MKWARWLFALLAVIVGCTTITGPNMDCYVFVANLTCYDAEGVETECYFPHCDCIDDDVIAAAMERDEPPVCLWEPAKGDEAPDWWRW